MKASILAGILRALLPALVAYLAGRGIDISGLDTPEVSAALAVLAAAIWSIRAKRKSTTETQSTQSPTP